MINVNMTPKQFADMIYESCMYKVHMVEQLNIIQEIWDNIEVETYIDPDDDVEPVVKKKANSKPRSKEIKLDYRR